MAQDHIRLKERDDDTALPETEGSTSEKEKSTERLKRKKTHTDSGGQWVPGEQKKGLAEKQRIIRERRLLRKDLKRKGIKSRKDFNAVANSLGLSLWKDNAFLAWLRFFWGGLVTSLGLKSLLLASAVGLTVLFLVSALSDKAGSFTINLTAEMLKAGFILSETVDFQREEARLFSKEIEEVNNITLSDIGTDVDEQDGSHNGQNYIAYTFYIKNSGVESASYAYYLRLQSETKNVSSAVWLMLFEDGRQVIYAQPMADGKPEELYGFKELPFADAAYDYDAQYYEKDGKYGILTTAYAEDGVVAQGIVENIAPGTVHKYTVVIWIEGYDPDCTDEIFGGYAKYSMDFEKVGAEEDENIFSGVYRKEYEDYDPLAEANP